MNFSIRFSYRIWADNVSQGKNCHGTRVITATDEVAARKLANELAPNLTKLNNASKGTLVIDDLVALG